MANSFAFVVFAVLFANHVLCKNTQLWNGLSVKIMVVGKTGVGKSTLINNIIDNKLAGVGDDLESETKTAKQISTTINGTGVKICDTPGFRDGQDKDKEYLNEIVNKCNNPDVILFCIRIDETRWTDDDRGAILSLNSALGKDIWSNTVLVLTFADHVNFDENREMAWKKKFDQQLEKIGVSKNVTSSIPAVMISNFVDPKLPDIRNWLPKLFSSCLSVSQLSGRNALLGIVMHFTYTGYLVDDEGYLKIHYCQIVHWMDDFGFAFGWILGAKFLSAWFAGPLVGIVGLVTGYGLTELLEWLGYCNGTVT